MLPHECEEEEGGKRDREKEKERTCWYSRSNFRYSSSQLSTILAKLLRFFTGLPLKARTYQCIRKMLASALQFRDVISKYVVHIFPDLSIDYIFISNINVSHKNLAQVLGMDVIELKMRKISSYIPWNKMTRKTDERLQEEPEKQQQAVRLLIPPLNVDACPRV